MSWKVFVQGREQAEYVRKVLEAMNLASSECVLEPSLSEPPVFSFVVSPAVESPLTAAELQSILEEDQQIKVAFDALSGT
jgi:hypothetical protein